MTERIFNSDQFSELTAEVLTRCFDTDYLSCVAETKASGIAVLNGAAMSRKHQAVRLFCRLGVPSNGRPGGRSRKARRCSTGTATPVSVAHPIAVGRAVIYRNWSNTMALIALQVREQRAVFRALRILEKTFKTPETTLSSPGRCRDYLRLRFAGMPREEFVALWLDAQNRLIDVETLSTGTLTQTSVYPREVAKAALRANAAAVIFAHNHPSGVAEPSSSDISLTRSLKNSLALIDVKLLDHLIVTELSVTSLAERGHV